VQPALSAKYDITTTSTCVCVCVSPQYNFLKSTSKCTQSTATLSPKTTQPENPEAAVHILRVRKCVLQRQVWSNAAANHPATVPVPLRRLLHFRIPLCVNCSVCATLGKQAEYRYCPFFTRIASQRHQPHCGTIAREAVWWQPRSLPSVCRDSRRGE